MPEENALILHMHELLQYLNRQGTNTFITVAQHGLVGDMKSPVDVTYLADTVILLRYFEAEGRVRRAISVIKKRTGQHEDTIREYMIGATGLILGEPLSAFQGILRVFPYSWETGSLFCKRLKRKTPIPDRDVQGLIHAPLGRDAQIAAALLKEAGLPSRIAHTLDALVADLNDNIAFAVMTEEALRSADLRPLSVWLQTQASWSDLPSLY